VSDNQEYFDKDGLAEYLGITEPMYYHHRLWEKIPNVKLGKTRIFKKEVVDWYILQNSADEVVDKHDHSRYKKFLNEKEKGRAALEKLNLSASTVEDGKQHT
jgi:hypothetical protein